MPATDILMISLSKMANLCLNLLDVCVCFQGMLYIPELQCSEFLETNLNTTSAVNNTQVLTCCTELYKW